MNALCLLREYVRRYYGMRAHCDSFPTKSPYEHEQPKSHLTRRPMRDNMLWYFPSF